MNTKKAFVTVSWAYTVEVDIPENISAEDLNDSPLADEIIMDASSMIEWKDGVITDIQDQF